MQTLWWPKHPRLRLFGLRHNDTTAEITSDPKEVHSLLKDHWEKVYEKKEVDENGMNTLLGIFSRRKREDMHFEDMRIPNEEDIGLAITYTKHSKQLTSSTIIVST